MRKAYVRELKPYSLASLASEFDMCPSDTLRMIEELMVRSIVRYRSGVPTDGMDLSDEERDAKPDELYEFAFVGMAMLHDLVLIAYPKYFRDRRPTDGELRQIMRVLKRDAGRASLASLNDDGDRTADKLPVMLALLELYAEYGLYSNFVEGRELNGAGAIDWNRTIGGHLPIVSNGAPIYAEYETRKTLRDESDFITRLHRAVITECSRELCDAGVGTLLSLDEVWLSDEEIDDFGDAEVLEWRLDRERGAQFVDWKILVLELLACYLLSRESTAERNEIRLLGSTSFYNLWEQACKVAFGDKLGTSLDGLGFPLAEGWVERKRDTLLGIIPRPKWERRVAAGYVPCGDVDTLIPDTITFAGDDADRRIFCIYDAKYYVPTTSGKMRNQPGLESVTKQFLYQSAYEKFIRAHCFDEVVNAFLVPSAGSHLREIGRVSFPEVMDTARSPLSNFVSMWALPASDIFSAYLRNERSAMATSIVGSVTLGKSNSD